MAPSPRRHTAPLGLLLSLTLATAGGCREPEQAPPRPQRAIKHATALAASSTVERTVGGTVRPVDSSPLSFGVGGTLQKLNVDVGDSVEEGQIIAALDQQPFDLNVRAAKASAEKARAGAKEARTSLDSFTEMYQSRAVSERQYDQQVAREASARSDLSLARAQVGLTQRDLEQSVLKAPFTGVITQRSVDNFEEVGPGQQIVVLQGAEGLEVVSQVPASVVSQLQVGQRAAVEFSTIIGKRFDAELSTVAASAGTGGTFEVTALLREASKEIRSGMSATVLFDLTATAGAPTPADSPSAAPSADAAGSEDAASAVEIPFGAIFAPEDDPDAAAVWVFDAEESVVRLRAVTTGEIRGETILVTSGLVAGEVVAAAGTSFLSNGQSVTLWEP